MKPLPWSFSSLSDFVNCARQYEHKRVLKDVEDPPNEAGIWGDYVHKKFEATLAKGAALPGNLAQYQEYLDRIASGKGEMHVECKYAINSRLEPCAWDDPNVWCRAILDVLHLHGQDARVLDHKTGKMRADSRQLKLCALMVFIHHPEIIRVKTGYFWLKDRQLTKDTFLRSQESELWETFLPDLRAYRQAFRTGVFPPKPSGLCNGWCPVTQCEFWKPKRSYKYG
ncbi:MAG TPA: PD-(D/E)XK nuclease family protein [Nitrospiraceae bacterium]